MSDQYAAAWNFAHAEMPNPTSDDMIDPVFLAIWKAIKSWDINVPHPLRELQHATTAEVLMTYWVNVWEDQDGSRYHGVPHFTRAEAANVIRGASIRSRRVYVLRITLKEPKP
jgi:hypothetical protein